MIKTYVNISSLENSYLNLNMDTGHKSRIYIPYLVEIYTGEQDTVVSGFANSNICFTSDLLLLLSFNVLFCLEISIIHP